METNLANSDFADGVANGQTGIGTVRSWLRAFPAGAALYETGFPAIVIPEKHNFRHLNLSMTP
jgi:hypothetical protein